MSDEQMSSPMGAEQSSSPDDMFRIIRGNPTEEELAAVLSVLLARARPAPEPVEQPRSGWAAYWRGVGAPIQPGPGSWRAAVRDR